MTTPTDLAVTSLRTRRAAGYHLTDNERLLLGALDQSEANEQELHLKLASAERQAAQMDDVIDSLGIPGAAAVTA